MTPRSRVALFPVPLVAVVVLLGLGLPNLQPAATPTVLIPAGTFTLDRQGSWGYGTVLEAPNEFYPLILPTYWTEFHAYLNDSAEWKITGSWEASEPVMVVLSWGSLWTPNSSISWLPHGCPPLAPSFCLNSLLLTSTQGRVDVVLSHGNTLCWNPKSQEGSCVALGDGATLGVYLDHGQSTFSGNGTVSVSATFVTPWYRSDVTVLEAFTLERVAGT